MQRIRIHNNPLADIGPSGTTQGSKRVIKEVITQIRLLSKLQANEWRNGRSRLAPTYT